MKLFVRNIQFLTVVLLQIMTIAILIVLLPQHTHNAMTADAIREDPCGLPKRELIRLEDIRTVITADEKKAELYGLSKEDFKRIKNIHNNKGEPEIVKHNLGHYKLEVRPKSRTVSAIIDQDLASDILVLIQKWQELDGPEKEKVAEEIGNKLKNTPETKKTIQALLDALDETVGNN